MQEQDYLNIFAQLFYAACRNIYIMIVRAAVSFGETQFKSPKLEHKSPKHQTDNVLEKEENAI